MRHWFGTWENSLGQTWSNASQSWYERRGNHGRDRMGSANGIFLLNILHAEIFFCNNLQYFLIKNVITAGSQHTLWQHTVISYHFCHKQSNQSKPAKLAILLTTSSKICDNISQLSHYCHKGWKKTPFPTTLYYIPCTIMIY